MILISKLSYEQVNLNDRFGQVMVDNLTSRGCGLRGYELCQSKQTQENRFMSAGFKKSNCQLMRDRLALSVLDTHPLTSVPSISLYY